MSKRWGSRPLTTADILKAKEALDKASQCECGGELDRYIMADPWRRVLVCLICKRQACVTAMTELEVAAWVRLTMALDGDNHAELSDSDMIEVLREAFAEAERGAT